ncbi:MAG: 4-hydroxybenzoate octaprenyltransferase [Sphingopyxis sp.]
MTMAPIEPSLVPDSEHRGFLALLPAPLRHYAVLARFDRPIGWWLLFWPCVWGVALAGGACRHWPLLFWFLLGAVAMRGAGCVYNDIIDRDLDARVERTKMRPLASGAVSVRSAWVWLIMLALVGLIVLAQLNFNAQLLAVESLLLVAAYPFMKRFTWWPQAWLGLVFSWGALVGWIAVAQHAHPAMFLLYLGSVAWVVGYDTIYALQDVEDDALVGIGSSARAMGRHVRIGVACCYAVAIAFWCAAFWVIRPNWLALLALLPAAMHLCWQVARLDPDDGPTALRLFRSNRMAGFLVALACVTVGTSV